MLVNILAEMARRNITRKELAKKLDMHEGTLDKKLRNEKSFFSIEQIEKIRKLFSDSTISLEYLIEDKEA